MRIILLLLIVFNLNAKMLYKANEVPKNMSSKTKKERFYALLVPAIGKVYNELFMEYKRVFNDMKYSRNLFYKDYLKEKYGVKTDKELLMILKPHPPSIVLAQAAIESAWATSRFFREANNVFGMWSANKNESRIAANVKRGGTKTIWLRKFESIEESVRAYYKLISDTRAYREFRELRIQTDNPYKLVQKLDRYSEIGELYTKKLAQLIRYNKLTKYDN
jgi:Bax protein